MIALSGLGYLLRWDSLASLASFLDMGSPVKVSQCPLADHFRGWRSVEKAYSLLAKFRMKHLEILAAVAARQSGPRDGGTSRHSRSPDEGATSIYHKR